MLQDIKVVKICQLFKAYEIYIQFLPQHFKLNVKCYPTNLALYYWQWREGIHIKKITTTNSHKFHPKLRMSKQQDMFLCTIKKQRTWKWKAHCLNIVGCNICDIWEAPMSLSLLPCPFKWWDPAPSPITFTQPTTALNALTNFATKKVNQHKCEPSSHLVK